MDTTKMNQPNLHDILFNLQYDSAGPSINNRNNARKEAIDAIYAGLLAEVIGDMETEYSNLDGDAGYWEKHGRNQKRIAEIKALKRWCYGDDSE